MIYEVRTYDIKGGSQAEVERRFGEAYEKRKKFSELAAFFHTEIGPLNQIIHIWPYADMEERARVRAAAIADKTWPPDIKDFIVAQRSEIFIPFPFSPPIKPGKYGPIFEMRTYTYPSGKLPLLMADLGALNKFMHIWPYASMNDRMETRAKAVAGGSWPPSAKAKKDGREAVNYLAQENKIVMPAAFSPVQ
ncbi:MAG: NIPSNAP family protein [Proteobacteria bacterium]|nr:NIPSNAP family protein [Pseudomonadota bacterium]